MLNILLAITLGPILSEILIIAAILVVLFIIFKLGNVMFGLILNSVLGLVALFIVNAIFGLAIVYNLLTIILVAVFGLPMVAVIIILKLIGVSI